MDIGSFSGQGMGCLLLCSCSCGGAGLEAEAVVSSLQNVAAMGEAIEERGGHLGIAEEAGHPQKPVRILDFVIHLSCRDLEAGRWNNGRFSDFPSTSSG